jgi:TonB family protein
VGGRPTSSPATATGRGGSDLVAFKDLSRRPQLTAIDPCHGYFPASANADSAVVVLRIVVTAEGRARSVQLVSETPSEQGFGTAARSCISTQGFVSALDKDGHAVPTSTSITVKFRR